MQDPKIQLYLRQLSPLINYIRSEEVPQGDCGDERTDDMVQVNCSGEVTGDVIQVSDALLQDNEDDITLAKAASLVEESKRKEKIIEMIDERIKPKGFIRSPTPDKGLRFVFSVWVCIPSL